MQVIQLCLHRGISPPCRLQNLQQELIPRIDWPRQAPMHAVARHPHLLPRRPPVPTRVPVRPHQHRRRRIQQPKPNPLLPPLPLRPPVLLDLRRVQLQIDPLQPRLVPPERPLPHAIAALVPIPVLKMRWREGPDDRRSLVPSKVDQVPKRGPERRSVAVGHREFGDGGVEAVVAADEAGRLVEHRRAEEPMAGRDDDVVEGGDLGSPRGVGLVEVEVEEAGEDRAVQVGVHATDEVGGPEVCDGEVVRRVEEAGGLVVWDFAGVHGICFLEILARKGLNEHPGLLDWGKAIVPNIEGSSHHHIDRFIS